MKKTAHIFPGQGSQFVGMAMELLGQESREAEIAREKLEKAEKILGFSIVDTMSVVKEEVLLLTKNCQIAVFIYSVILYFILNKKQLIGKPDMVAGHSLGEISALVAAGVLTFQDGLRLVLIRSNAMQKACENGPPSAMAAIIGMESRIIEKILASVNESISIVVANYNSQGQTVISGTVKGVNIASEKLKNAGAKMIVPLKVQGAFHSPLMESARRELEKAIRTEVKFQRPNCPIYQNVDGRPSMDRVTIRKKLIAQITSPVHWHQTVLNMEADGVGTFIEIGPDNVLQNLVRRIVSKETIVYSFKRY